MRIVGYFLIYIFLMFSFSFSVSFGVYVGLKSFFRDFAVSIKEKKKDGE